MYSLMNGDVVTMYFDLDDFYIEVINNDMLPYELKDFVKTTDLSDVRKTIRDLEVIKDFLSSRLLLLSREHAKEILNATSLPQNMRTSERLKIVFACKGLTMQDSFWIKSDKEVLQFEDVNLRRHKLSEVSYEVAILGKYISATARELCPDLTTAGMYPKFWKRTNGTVELWKTDKTTSSVNSKAEVMAFEILKACGVPAADYRIENKDDRTFSVSKCIADDIVSLVPAMSVRDWCVHVGRDFTEFIMDEFVEEFANMCVVDYVLANTDRHFENWGFLVNNYDNSIKGFAPLYDHNQALIADEFGTCIDDLVYEPTGLSFLDTIQRYRKYATVDMGVVDLPPKCAQRWESLKRFKKVERSIAFGE